MQLPLQEGKPYNGSLLSYWKRGVFMAGGMVQVLSIVPYFSCKHDWTQRKKKKKCLCIYYCLQGLPGYYQSVDYYTFFHRVQWTPTYQRKHPTKTPTRREAHSRRALYSDCTCLLPIARASAGLGTTRGRGGKGENFFYFCIPEFTCLWHDKPYVQHFCNLSSTLLSCTPSCLLLPSGRIQFENTSQFLKGKLEYRFFFLFF